MTVARLADVLVLLFPVSEMALAVWKRAHPGSAVVRDRGSVRVLWLVIGLSVAAAIVVQNYPPTRVHVPLRIRSAVAIVLLLAGLGLRWWAILTLGRFFTVDVAVHESQQVIESGPYQVMRHPSYTGLLLAFLGLAASFGNFLSLVVLMIPATLAIAHRIRIEEAALREKLGDPYVEYCRRTKRLIPGVI